jgi:predicted  nucleic acid-binding Zn-ribbon protein
MKYIQNIHTAPITAVVKNAKGAVILTRKFSPARVDKFTGRVAETGFTELTDEEYTLLDEGSKTFTVYRDKHKLLVEHDELPPEAKTPHEALVDAKREARKSADHIASLNDELVKLKAELLDTKKQYANLLDASGSGAEVSRLTNELEAAKQTLKAAIDAGDNAVKVLTEECAKLKAAMESAVIERDAAITELKAVKEKLGKKGKEFD